MIMLTIMNTVRTYLYMYISENAVILQRLFQFYECVGTLASGRKINIQWYKLK